MEDSNKLLSSIITSLSIGLFLVVSHLDFAGDLFSVLVLFVSLVVFSINIFAHLGGTTPNKDDTYNVFINENLSDIARRVVLDHELRHIYSDHFNSFAPLAQLEEDVG